MATVEQAKSLLSQHGKLRPQPAEDWGGDFPLPMAAGLALLGNLDSGDMEALVPCSNLASLLDSESGADRVLAALGYDY